MIVTVWPGIVDSETGVMKSASAGHEDPVLPAVRQNMADFVGGAEQFDDITMLGFTYLAPAGHETGGL